MTQSRGQRRKRKFGPSQPGSIFMPPPASFYDFFDRFHAEHDRPPTTDECFQYGRGLVDNCLHEFALQVSNYRQLEIALDITPDLMSTETNLDTVAELIERQTKIDETVRAILDPHGLFLPTDGAKEL